MQFVKGLGSDALAGVRVAAFDTRVDVAQVGSKFLTFMVKLFGYAAKPIAKGLERRGGVRAAVPEGERDRAEGWARSLTSV